jgi:hypothetical protein
MVYTEKTWIQNLFESLSDAVYKDDELSTLRMVEVFGPNEAKFKLTWGQQADEFWFTLRGGKDGELTILEEDNLENPISIKGWRNSIILAVVTRRAQ